MREPCGRVSLSPTAAITTLDYANAQSLFYVPVQGRTVPLWDGSGTVDIDVGGGLSLALDPDATHQGYHASDAQMNAFIVLTPSGPRLGTGPVGAGLVMTADNWLANSATIAVRIGPNAADLYTAPALTALAVSLHKWAANGRATDSSLRRLCSNIYRTAPRPMAALVPPSSGALWNNNGAFWQWAMTPDLPLLEFVTAVGGRLLRAEASALVINSSGTPNGVAVGIGLSSTSTDSGQSCGFEAVGAYPVALRSSLRALMGPGSMNVLMLAWGDPTGGAYQTWYRSQPPRFMVGLTGEIEA